VKRDLTEVAGRRFDVAIIGGGITGAGVARHAAIAGLSTVLLEASDFAAGTSSRSTKLIHGGLRYLAMGDVALVRESALERKHLHNMAPHLTEPRWMVVPARNRVALMKLRAGITAYEKLGAVTDADLHRNWDAQALAIEEPGLDRNEFPYACVYREYLTDDARLVIATLRSAAGVGAQVINHARVLAVREEKSSATIEFADAVTAQTLSVQADVVVNATGPWVEEIERAATENGCDHPRLHLSKGVHIAVPAKRLPVSNMVMLTAADGRPVFAIPRGTVTYIGTTDTSFPGGPDLWPDVTREDVEYLLEPLRSHFPSSPLSAHDVVGAWAGLRPLINQPGKPPKEMSRKEAVWCDGRRVTIAGGKLTGFRKMAEQVMAQVARILDKQVELASPADPLPGGVDCNPAGLITQLRQRLGVEEMVAERLVRLYGSEVFTVLGNQPDPIGRAVFAQEVDWAVEEECAIHLEDVVYRRLRIPWFQPEDTEAAAVAAARIMSRKLCWSAQREQEELRTLAVRLSRDLTFCPE
jgi:glycerol-3-phosphate dehydrogenase